MRFPSAELSGAALRCLLGRMGADADSAGAALAALRQRLHDFFDRRGVPEPALLADETLDRVARKIEAGEPVESVPAYCHGVAKRVLLEWHREHAREAAAVRGSAAGREAPAPSSEARVACLERCLLELEDESRDVIVGYYQGEGSARFDARKALADTLSVKPGALRTRAYRLRGQLQECLRRCLAEGGDD
jgi:DNA-directed RNA polymerase specialized sigma24 family protein